MSQATVSALWKKDLAAAGGQDVPWLWHGYLAPGLVTLLVSQWKSGKTTLLSVILDRMKAGQTLAGRALRPGKALVVSEESPALWLQRGRKHDFGENVCWLCRPFRGKPREADWRRLLDQIAELHRQFGFDLAVFDPLAAVLPGRDENNAGPMLDALGALSALTERGLAVLLLHHTRKAVGAEGQSARGSGALTGFADILIEMHWYSRASEDDRRRRLVAWSRHDDTPRRLVIELNKDGTDYTALGDFETEEFTDNWATLESVLKSATGHLTRQKILDHWPEGETKPDGSNLWRWLTRGVNDGRILREGTGRKNDSYRYWLPGQREAAPLDPLDFGPLPEIAPLDPMDLARMREEMRREEENEFFEELLREKARRAKG